FEQAGPSGEFTVHQFTNLPIAKSGYLFVYVSNQTTDISVYFDNLQVTHIRGPLIEETHYYPFGLAMAGISSKAAGAIDNRKKFNGIEHTTEFDLNTYEAHFRTLDPQIGRWHTIDPRPNFFESPYAAMGNNPILKADPLGDTAIYYSYGGKELYRINDGSKRITPTIVSTKHQKAFNAAIADGKATTDELKGFGITYDTKAFSKFYTDNKSKFKANTVGGNDIASADKVMVNGKTVDKNSLKAEATGNTVLKDGVVTVGNNPAQSANSMTGSVQDAGDEPGRSGSIHLHPTHTKMEVTLQYGFSIKGVTIYGGAPSPGDHTEHQRGYEQAGSPSGQHVRSVMVDAKYIYLYNSSANQTIKIPRL
ncbi:MAG TPA: RHS repeat-associated core domain-containing protein, partial [Chitinophagaceae bacterium]|nr:RHS repeat-associated core domain-containing protein [Chitinophagaceae bacterium]